MLKRILSFMMITVLVVSLFNFMSQKSVRAATTISVGSFIQLKNAVETANATESEYVFSITNNFNVQASESVELKKSDVTLKGNGHTITVENDKSSAKLVHYFVVVSGSATLNLGIDDTSNTLKIKDEDEGEDYTLYQIPRIKVNSLEATINLYDGYTSSVGYSVAGTFNMYGGKLSGMKACVQYQTFFNVEINNVVESFSLNDSSSEANINVYGGEISNNHARGIYVEGNSNCNVKKINNNKTIIFSENHLHVDGVGIYSESSGKIEIKNALFDSNNSDAIHTYGSQDTLPYGTAINLKDADDVIISDCVFTNNTETDIRVISPAYPRVHATIMIDNSEVLIDKCAVEDNDSAIRTIGSSNLTINESSIKRNNNIGFSVYGDAVCDINDTEIENNKTEYMAAGGININTSDGNSAYTGNSATVTCDENTVICNNTSNIESTQVVYEAADVASKNCDLVLPDASNMNRKFGNTDYYINGWFSDCEQIDHGYYSPIRYDINGLAERVKNVYDNTETAYLIAAYTKNGNDSYYKFYDKDGVTGILDFNTGEYKWSGSGATGPGSYKYIPNEKISKCVETVSIDENFTEVGGCQNLVNIKKIDLPKNTEKILESAFDKDTSLEKMYIPDSVTTIERYAFSNCANLEYVYMSDNVSEIGTDIFYNHGDSLLVSVKKGSYAEQYCIDNNINYTNERKKESFLTLKSQITQKGSAIIFEGRLEDSIGNWIGDKTVKIFNDDTDELLSTITTDGLGYFKYYDEELEIGTYNLKAKFEGDYEYEASTAEATIIIQDATYGIQNPRISNDLTTWDCITFGKYPQSSDGQGGFVNEPIKWRVLSVDDNKALLISDKNLDSKKFIEEESDDVKWSASTLHSWLNGSFLDLNITNSFYDTAFTLSEKQSIITTQVSSRGGNVNDKVFLLGIDDLEESSYGFGRFRMGSSSIESARFSHNTEYAIHNGGYTLTEEEAKLCSLPETAVGNGTWWLRTECGFTGYDIHTGQPGETYYVGSRHINVDSTINLSPTYGTVEGFVVRPMITLDLTSTEWEKVGTVSSDGTESNAKTVSIDGVEYDSVEKGENITLPSTAQIGYLDGDELYKPGSSYTVTDDVDIKSINSVSNTIMSGAAMKFDTKDSRGLAYGMQFKVNNKTENEILNSRAFKTGMVMTTADMYYETFMQNLSLERFNQWFANNKTPGHMINVENFGTGSAKWLDGEVGTYRCGISSVSDDNISREFMGRGYVVLEFTDGTEQTIYSSISDIRSIQMVAIRIKQNTSYYNSLTEEQKSIVDYCASYN